MPTIDLVEVEDEDGDYISVWMDEEETVIVQYNFVLLTFDYSSFRGFVDAINRAKKTFEKKISK